MQVPAPLVAHFIAQSQATHRLTVQDQAVWSKLLPLLPRSEIQIRFDVRLGEGKPPGPDASPQQAAMWKSLTQYRVDVGLLTRNSIILIELKPIVSHSLIGQLLAYRAAMTQTVWDSPAVTLIGCAQFGDDFVERVAATYRLNLATLANLPELFFLMGVALHQTKNPILTDGVGGGIKYGVGVSAS